MSGRTDCRHYHAGCGNNRRRCRARGARLRRRAETQRRVRDRAGKGRQGRRADHFFLGLQTSINGNPDYRACRCPPPTRKYPSRDQLVAYLEDYAAHQRIAPRFGTTVLGVRQRAGWMVETDAATLTAGMLFSATGIAGWPLRPAWPGMESFPGRLIHSSDYANPKPFSRCRVLVVGLGNSGGEIAMDFATPATRCRCRCAARLMSCRATCSAFRF